MRRTPINPKEASVAATIFEPTYQRLRQWHRGREINLLCFVHPTNAAVGKMLDELGAARSADFRAKCFAEVWELADSPFLAKQVEQEICELDLRISKALGCLDGKYSAEVGQVLWGDIKEGWGRRRVASKLLQECQPQNKRVR